MKKLLFFLFIISSIALSAQNSMDVDAMRRQVQKQRASLDSSMKRSDSMLRSQSKYFDSVSLARDMEQNNRNLSSFVNNLREREKKEKQKMWMRIGLGIVFLAIGIIGVTRKRKVKK